MSWLRVVWSSVVSAVLVWLRFCTVMLGTCGLFLVCSVCIDVFVRHFVVWVVVVVYCVDVCVSCSCVAGLFG